MWRVLCLGLLTAGCRLWFDNQPADAAAGDGIDASGDVNMLGTHRVYVKASNADAGDQFGLSIALSADGSTLAVGAPLEAGGARTINGNETDNTASEAGAVYVFRRTSDTWAQEAYIKPANVDLGDQFGWSVALDGTGNSLVVGARREDGSSTGVNGTDDNAAISAGAAYVFLRSGTTWTQEAYLKASNAEAGDAYGERVAISQDGSTIAVQALQEASATNMINGNQTSNTAPLAGAVYTYTRTLGMWSQQAYIKPSNMDAGDEFGWKLALSADGRQLLVGSWREDSASSGVGGNETDDSLNNAGAVYLFERLVTQWVQTTYIKASNPGLGYNFGYSLGMSGDGTRFVIGAPAESSPATGINGDQTLRTASAAGALYAFGIAGPTWSQNTYVKASNTEAGDEIGFSLALSATGTVLAGCAYNEASAATGVDGDQADNSAPLSGAAYVFVDAGGWSQHFYIKATNTGANDQFGWACALSGTGGTLAASAPFEDGSARGIGGTSDDNATDSGAVYLYY